MIPKMFETDAKRLSGLGATPRPPMKRSTGQATTTLTSQ